MAGVNVRTVPSDAPGDKTPGSDPYFTGGYNTKKYGSMNEGTVDAIQIEGCQDHRFSSRSPGRAEHTERMIQAIKKFFAKWYLNNC